MYTIEMWILFFQALWLGLPAAFSNMAPPISSRFMPKLLNIPIDFGLHIRERRILGDNKTIRGFIVGILAGEIVFLLQQQISTPIFEKISILPYSHLPWLFGFLFGIGALGGDAIESVIKRQLGIIPGKTWFPFDQIDWAIGTLIAISIFVPIPFNVIIVGLLFGVILHLLTKFTGFLLGIDTQPI